MALGHQLVSDLLRDADMGIGAEPAPCRPVQPGRPQLLRLVAR